MSLTPEQRALRASRIGASEMASVLGLSPFCSRARLWEIKAGLAPDEFAESDAMRCGTALEPLVLEKAEEMLGDRLFSALGSVVHPDEDWMLATLDAVPKFLLDGSPAARRGYVVEAKTAKPYHRAKWGDPMTADVPPHYYVQVQAQMTVARARYSPTIDEAIVAVMFGLGEEFALYRVPFDPDLSDQIVAVGRHFMDAYVRPRVRPPADESEDCARVLARAYPTHTDDLVECDGSTEEGSRALEAAASLRAAREQLDAAKRAATLAENRVKELIGDRAGLRGPFGSITWRATKQSVKPDDDAVLAALVEASPVLAAWVDDLRAAHTKTSGGHRQMRCSFAND